VLVQHLTRAGWSVVVRRTAENVMGTLPIFAVLFIPVAIGLHHTHHHWWHYEPGVDPILDHKRVFLNPTFFFVRVVIYFGVWTWLSMTLRRRSVEQDQTGNVELSKRNWKLSTGGMALFALSITFAAIDWIKSMDPHWFSTMWGVYYFAGAAVGIFSTMVVVNMSLQRDGYLVGIINQEHFHDIGKLLFGFVVFWSYIAFSQYFLIWYANIPEETIWFTHRLHGSWRGVGLLLMFGHFFLPFFFLLPRGIKRRRSTLLIGACWVLFIHYVDLYWVIMPMLHPDGFSPSLVDLTAWLGVGGVFLGAFAYLASKDALLPVKDPRLPESLAFENF
jgi:hypothetical protein